VSAGERAVSDGARASWPRRAVTPVRLVVAVGLLAIVLAGVAILAQSAPRRAGTNLTANTGYVIKLPPGGQLCEPGELVPGDTGALRLSADSGPRPGPRLQLTMADARGQIAAGGAAGGWHSGTLTIPVSRVRETKQGVQICLVNRGTEQVAFGGSVPDANFYVVLAGKPLNGRMRIEYMRPGSESWLSLLPTLAHRFSLAKGDIVRHWAAGAAIVLMLLAIVLALRTVLMEELRQ
jgi:hypothetical protein